MTATWRQGQHLRLVHPRPTADGWSPFQVLAPMVGALAVVAGLITIGHSGFHAEHVFEPHDMLAGLHYTPLFAACALGFGVAMLAGAVLVRVARTRVQLVSGLALGLGTVVLTIGGAAALGLGVVVLADVWPSQLHHWLNVDHGGGVVAVVAGSVGLAAAITAPLTVRRTAATALAPETEHESPAPDPDEPEQALDPTLSDDEQAS